MSFIKRYLQASRSDGEGTLQRWVELSSLLIVDEAHSEHGAYPEEGNVGCNDEHAIPAVTAPGRLSPCSCEHSTLGTLQCRGQSLERVLCKSLLHIAG